MPCRSQGRRRGSPSARRRRGTGDRVRHLRRAEHFAGRDRRHRQLVGRRSRQRDDEGRLAGWPALLPGISLYVLCPHEARRHRGSPCIPEDAAGGSGCRPRPQAFIPVQHPSRRWRMEASLHARRARRGCRRDERAAGAGAIPRRGPGTLWRVPYAAAVLGRSEARPLALRRQGRRRRRHRAEHHAG